MIKRQILFLLLTVPLAAVSGQGSQTPTPADTETLTAVWEAEDRRGAGDGMSVILNALRHEDDRMRAIAVRSVGRLERPHLVSAIVPLLDDKVAMVRIAAANAIAQSVFNQNTELATRELTNRLELETDKPVRAALVSAVGRLPYESADRIAFVESVLLRNTIWDDPRLTLEVARGWDSFTRRVARRHDFSDGSIAILDSLAAFVAVSPGRARRINNLNEIGADVREMGVLALAATGNLDSIQLERALGDEAWEVRRAGISSLRTQEAPPTDVLSAGLRDPSHAVRIEALSIFGRADPSSRQCGPLLGATADQVANVALTAIDILANGCNDRSAAVSRLRMLASQPINPDAWHIPMHALVSLATLDPDWTRDQILSFADHPLWWVRLYTARAADKLDALGLLERFARDDHGNVREAALRGLVRLLGREADPFLIENLTRPDYQLVLTAARALEGTTHPEALPTLFQALLAITAQGRMTSRDPRRAIVDRINELGNASVADALAPYLRDFDPQIAFAVADIIERWTGERVPPYPGQSNREFPDFNDLRRLDGSRVTVHMSRGGSFTIRLFAFDAPTNVTRFVYLALQRHFEQLTFHRVVPNFVIQGGSPGANEYMADGPFTRDEITSRAHTRGTVGLSTRGRDTADSQIFVNLVDNRRLDYNYTIIGEVIEGMGVVDQIVEGDIIQRVSVGR